MHLLNTSKDIYKEASEFLYDSGAAGSASIETVDGIVNWFSAIAYCVLVIDKNKKINGVCLARQCFNDEVSEQYKHDNTGDVLVIEYVATSGTGVMSLFINQITTLILSGKMAKIPTSICFSRISGHKNKTYNLEKLIKRIKNG